MSEKKSLLSRSNSDLEYDVISPIASPLPEDYEIIEKNQEENLSPKEEDKKERIEKPISKLISVPTSNSHPRRSNPKIPLTDENVEMITVPIQKLKSEYYELIKHEEFIGPSQKKYVNVPTEWVYYEGNPAFVDDALLKIFDF